MPRPICAVSVGYPGVLQWLGHGERCGFWDLRRLPGLDADGLEDYEVVLLGAWHPSYEALVEYLATLADPPRVVIAWSSSPTEMDNAHVELEYVRQLTSSPWREKIAGWGCLHPGLVPHLPNGFHLPAPVHVEPVPKRPERYGIGFYAPCTPKKNVLTQLLAVKQHQMGLEHRTRPLYTNLGPYRGAMDLLQMDFHMDDWIEKRATYLERLAGREVCLAVSHAESWCYGAIDALMAGTPFIGSPTVPFTPHYWRVSNPNDPGEIRGAIERVIETGEGPGHLLERTAAYQNEAVRVTIEALLDGSLAGKPA